MEEGRELAGFIEAFGRKVGPALFLQDAPVDLVVPEDVERLALGVVIGAGETDQGRVARVGVEDFLDEPAAGADLD